MYQGLINISTERMAVYGPIHRTWILGERNVFVADAACVRKVLNGEHTIAEGEHSTIEIFLENLFKPDLSIVHSRGIAIAFCCNVHVLPEASLV